MAFGPVAVAVAAGVVVVVGSALTIILGCGVKISQKSGWCRVLSCPKDENSLKIVPPQHKVIYVLERSTEKGNKYVHSNRVCVCVC